MILTPKCLHLKFPQLIMIPLTAIALISVALFSGLDAILGYLTNILLIPVYQSICIRMVRPAKRNTLTL